jgi:hypothetical protein
MSVFYDEKLQCNVCTGSVERRVRLRLVVFSVYAALSHALEENCAHRVISENKEILLSRHDILL